MAAWPRVVVRVTIQNRSGHNEVITREQGLRREATGRSFGPPATDVGDQRQEKSGENVGSEISAECVLVAVPNQEIHGATRTPCGSHE